MRHLVCLVVVLRVLGGSDILAQTATVTSTATPTGTLVPIGMGCNQTTQCTQGSACVGNVCQAFTPTGTPTPPQSATRTSTRTQTRTPTRTATRTRTPTPAGRVLSINDIRFAEGHKLAIFFTVTLSQAANVEVRVNYFPSDGTAIADLDYFASQGTLVFTPGQTQQRIFVSFRDDSLPEKDETFFMNLTAPFNAAIGRGRGVATIVDDDTVGAMELIPPESSVAAGERHVLTLRWVHPVGWRGLDRVDLRLVDDEETILWVRFHEAANALALCEADDDCQPGAFGGGQELIQSRRLR